MTPPFNDFYRNKTVLVTGDTGFKGSWLASWLNHLGAKVAGFSLDPPTDPSHFAACRMADRILHLSGDVCDCKRLEEVMQESRPDVVFHLAAQPLVRRSFRDPRLTFDVNVMGTVNVLEAARRSGTVSHVVVVTSDKCYRNLEWEWGYRESDRLGGQDPYSASKACAELVAATYQSARFQENADPPCELMIATARAGNVVGGGDWAEDRLIPDVVRAIAAQSDVVVRQPSATRPWQHVLEALSGYLWLAAVMHTDRERFCSAWNFGPGETQLLTARQVVEEVLERWAPPSTRCVLQQDSPGAEAMLLRVDCSKAAHYLRWRAAWGIAQTLDATVDWYKGFYSAPDEGRYNDTVRQIEAYTNDAREQGIPWAGYQ